jgi:hypothetical protein
MESNSLRGSRLGAESHERTTGVELSARQTTEFVCANHHSTEIIFAAEAEVPNTWDCKKCSLKASRVSAEELEAEPETKVARTHYDFLLERRTKEELEVILKEALDDLRKRRKKAS